jgi:hypothetical protein
MEDRLVRQIIKTIITSEDFTKRYEERIIPINLWVG